MAYWYDFIVQLVPSHPNYLQSSEALRTLKRFGTGDSSGHVDIVQIAYSTLAPNWKKLVIRWSEVLCRHLYELPSRTWPASLRDSKSNDSRRLWVTWHEKLSTTSTVLVHLSCRIGQYTWWLSNIYLIITLQTWVILVTMLRVRGTEGETSFFIPLSLMFANTTGLKGQGSDEVDCLSMGVYVNEHM